VQREIDADIEAEPPEPRFISNLAEAMDEAKKAEEWN
jgi:hypothetical protein